MLIIEQYGVKLKRVEESDIELIRYWRNKEDISSFMEYRKTISAEDQVRWFHSINNKYNYYFIIEFENKKTGLINAKNYDPEKGFGEGGIFIWDKEYINSFVAVFSSLCLLNFVFKLNFCKVSRIRILKDNERAIHYNKLLGYRLLSGQDNVNNQLYELHYADYIKSAGKLNKAAAILSETNGELQFSGDVCEENLPVLNDALTAQRL